LILPFLCAAVFFTAIGLPLARLIAPRAMPALAMAPALGWAVFVTIALPYLEWVGFGRGSILTLAVLAGALAVFCQREPTGAILPWWGLALPAGIGVLPAMAILPKTVPGGVLLAPPMFDHVKIALVDAILRDGLPAPNPFIGPGSPDHLAYYYLWHAGTAMLASALHAKGWTAEAAMTWFTAFASLALMMGVAVALGGRAVAMGATALLALPGCVRPVLDALAGQDAVSRVVPQGADFGGWLNQSAWVPQHLSSACCVVLAGLLMVRLAEAGSLLTAAVLGVVVAAGFESSIWVGGFAFAVAGAGLGLMLLWRMLRAAAGAFLARGAIAALLAVILMAPFISAELHAARLRGGGGIAVMPYPVLGTLIPAGWRPAADLAAFWPLVALELPAVLPLGVMLMALRRGADRSGLADALRLLAALCLCTAWLLRSTIDNNDLGWRAVLPAVLLLAAFAGCALERLADARRWRLVAAAAFISALGLPDTVRMLRDYAGGQRPGDAPGLAAASSIWQAVRRHTGPDDRVANNPDDVARATPWPVNIAWATLSDRPSCYAGWETVLAYGTLTKPELLETALRFRRVFDGQPQPGDVDRMARDENCAVAVVVPADGAWARDPFVGGQYALAEAAAGWRIYRRK
jgi:hypothetical protein